MSNHLYRVNSRDYHHVLPVKEEVNCLPNKNYLFDLATLACIDVIGSKSREFLQGQVSCDIQKINSNHMNPGIMCNLKGRILAMMDIIDWDGLHLILPQDLMDSTIQVLNKSAAFSQVKLVPSSSYRILGLYVQNNDDALPFEFNPLHEIFQIRSDENHCYYYLGDGFYIILIKTPLAAVGMTCEWRGALGWHAQALKHHRFEIYPESSSLFLPHRLGLHETGHISFDKGCYKGQEIIARMHYLGKHKHELRVQTIITHDKLYSGQQLTNDRQDMGELIDYCPIDNHQYLIVVSTLKTFNLEALVTIVLMIHL